jgi:hypothetical protein
MIAAIQTKNTQKWTEKKVETWKVDRNHGTGRCDEKNWNNWKKKICQSGETSLSSQKRWISAMSDQTFRNFYCHVEESGINREFGETVWIQLRITKAIGTSFFSLSLLSTLRISFAEAMGQSASVNAILLHRRSLSQYYKGRCFAIRALWTCRW